MANGVGRRHHDARVLQHLLARVVDEEPLEKESGTGEADQERGQNRKVELCSESHPSFPPRPGPGATCPVAAYAAPQDPCMHTTQKPLGRNGMLPSQGCTCEP